MLHVVTTLICLAAAGTGNLERVADQVAQQIVKHPKHIAHLYHPSFLRQVNEKKLIGLYEGFFAEQGRVMSVSLIERKSDTAGQFSFVFEKGVRMNVTLAITSGPKPKIVTLLFQPPIRAYDDISKIVKDIQALPGRVGLELAQLGDEIKVLHAHNADAELAIGSTFKLYVLGALIEDRVAWDRVVHIKDKYKSLPSGVLQNYPDGAPITVHTLAAQMISISDNTGADHLLHLLGRKRVESVLGSMGHADPKRAWPMLSTREMFVLKSDTKLLGEYLKADLAGRRALLRTTVAGVPRDELSPYPDGGPMAIDQVEWFASASDLCRLMDWFRRKNDKTALDILAMNHGVDVSKDLFAYVGYKGGSEPGVLNMTWLLTTKDGTSFALSVGWNNPTTEGADLIRLVGMVQPLIDLLGKNHAG